MGKEHLEGFKDEALLRIVESQYGVLLRQNASTFLSEMALKLWPGVLGVAEKLMTVQAGLISKQMAYKWTEIVKVA